MSQKAVRIGTIRWRHSGFPRIEVAEGFIEPTPMLDGSTPEPIMTPLILVNGQRVESKTALDYTIYEAMKTNNFQKAGPAIVEHVRNLRSMGIAR